MQVDEGIYNRIKSVKGISDEGYERLASAKVELDQEE